MVGAVARRPVAVAPAIVARQEPIERRQRVVVGAGAELEDPTPAVACGTNTESSPSPPPACSATNRRQAPVRSVNPRSTRPDLELAGLQWQSRAAIALRSLREDRCRSASRSRPRPPIAGADS